MTLPTSGPLSLSDIQTEFGGSNPISLSEYYAGGSYVPSGTTGTNGAVPTSGTIAISNFYGTSKVVIQLTSPVTVAYASGGFLSATTGYRVANDGYVYTGGWSVSPSYGQEEQWDNVVGTVGNYEIYVSKTSGDTPTGTLNTWLNLGTTRDWTLTATAGNFKTCVLAVQIRDTATSTVQATATLTLESDAT